MIKKISDNEMKNVSGGVSIIFEVDGLKYGINFPDIYEAYFEIGFINKHIQNVKNITLLNGPIPFGYEEVDSISTGKYTNRNRKICLPLRDQRDGMKIHPSYAVSYHKPDNTGWIKLTRNKL